MEEHMKEGTWQLPRFYILVRNHRPQQPNIHHLLRKRKRKHQNPSPPKKQNQLRRIFLQSLARKGRGGAKGEDFVTSNCR